MPRGDSAFCAALCRASSASNWNIGTGGRPVVRRPALFHALVYTDEKLFQFERGFTGSRVLYSPTKNNHWRGRPTDGKARIRVMLFGLFVAVPSPTGPITFGSSCIVPSGADGSIDGPVYNDVLEHFVTPIMMDLGPDYVLLEDNASAHRACSHVAMPFQRLSDGVYPAHSPDFNAIERLWAHTQTTVQCHINNDPTILEDVVLLQKLLTLTYYRAARSPSAMKTIQGTWNNLIYAARNGGRQNPHTN